MTYGMNTTPTTQDKRWYGKYRGFVTHNEDPEKLGRIRAIIPEVLGDSLSCSWATPCFPPDYFSVPEIDEVVWIEFESGLVDLPIWTGVPYGTKKKPPTSVNTNYQKRKVIHTESGHKIILDDESNEILIENEKATSIIKMLEDGKRIISDCERIKNH